MDTARHRHTRKLFPLIGICTVGALSFASCGDDDASTPAATPEVAVSGQWARTSPAMATAGAVYVTLTSTTDDKLLGAKVDPSVAGTVEVHETVMADGATDTTMGMGSATTAMGGGEMTMRPVEFVALPAGVAVAFQPGGYHIMLLDLAKPLEIGSTIQVTLVFEKTGEMTIDVPVLDEAP